MTQHQQLPPAVMKIVLGAELERQRLRAEVTQEQSAQRLRCGQSKIAHIEGGSGIKAMELDALLDLYGADDNDTAYARALQAESNRRTKRGAFSTRFKQQMRLLVDMEPSCNELLSHQAMVIPGLLQTEDYMRAQFRAWRPSPTQATSIATRRTGSGGSGCSTTPARSSGSSSTRRRYGGHRSAPRR
ncbi:helix-turn-helix domain-containing protein [Amycolatopsis rubida]|uniref:Helix-turn-helix domain-containing protein n=1 Tax=Amycolatopsis rubida TaxID=112413 RepID=A0A1I5E361_9PSEU|nr:Helix-turn-helix domain-containing protein [Amycolatopsis rubida]